MANKAKKKENVFRTIARWFVRFFFGLKYEEKWFHLNVSKTDENQKDSNVPDDSDLIVSPGRAAFQRFMSRKFAVISVFVVLFMFLFVFIGPKFLHKYSDAYTEVTLKNVPPCLSMMKVPAELKNDIKMIDGYGSFSVGLSNAGKVYVWGSTKIGASNVDVKNIPDEVKNAKIVWVAAGVDHIIAFDENGKYYGWGNNRFAQIARDEKVEGNPNLELVPDEIWNNQIDVNQIKKVVCGYQASAVLLEDGTVYVWGNKQAIQNLENFIGRKNIKDIDFTLNMLVAIDNKQTSIVTGKKGLFTTAKTSLGTPGIKMADFLAGRKIESIDAGYNFVALVLSDGTIGYVGDALEDSIDLPNTSEEQVIEISTGMYHATVITAQGNVYSFGGDHYRQAENPVVTGAAHVYTGAFQSYAVDENGKLIDSWGLKGFLFGTDDAGADIAQRVIAGGRVTMTFGAIAVIIEILLGVPLGCLAGYCGKWVDILVMRIGEVVSSIPVIPFMLIFNSLTAQKPISSEKKLLMMMFIYGFLGWPGFCSLTRAQILVARENEYVTAAQAMGVKGSRIALKHILPNVLSVILVSITLSFAGSLQTETSLSFLGFGVMYPQPSWGNMLARASNATAAINFWWQWVFTSFILIFTTVCINTIGDTLRDVLDPKSNER